MKGLNKKLGPLKLWHWLAIGGATGVAVYLYKRGSSSAAPAVNPEEEEKLLGALRAAGSGGGGEGSAGGGVAAPGPIGITGEVGGQGVEGAQGPQGEPVNLAPLETSVANLEHQLATNNPPTVSHNTAAQGKRSHLAKNSKGEEFRVVHKGGATYHEYPHRKGPTKLVKIGGKPHGKPTGHAQKPRPGKRPKPAPIHQRVAVHHAPAHRAAPKPVHHPPAKRKRR